MFRTLFTVLFFCLSFGLLGAAERPSIRIVLLPVHVKSELEAQTFLQILEERVEAMAERKVNLVVPAADDPRLQGVNLAAPLGLNESLKLAEGFQADYLVTLDVRMEHRLEKRPAGQILTVAGRAVVTVTSKPDHNQVVHGPLVFRSDLLEGSEGTPAFTTRTQDLTAETARDLASAIVTETRGH